MWKYRRDGNRSCGNPAGMEYVHTGTRSLADNKNSDALVLKFFLQLFLSDSKETTLAGELCRKTRRQSMDPKVAADLRQSTDRKDLWRGPKWLGTKLSVHLKCFFYTSFNICWFLLRTHYICVAYNKGIHCEATWRSEGQERLSTTTGLSGCCLKTFTDIMFFSLLFYLFTFLFNMWRLLFTVTLSRLTSSN